MKENKEEVVTELNALLFEKGEEEMSFSWLTNGNIEVIMFEDIVLWQDDMDERTWDNGEYIETLLTHLKRKFNELSDRLNKLRF